MSDTKLLEKIIRAKVKLEEGKASHTEGCPVEDPTGYGGQCKCGADKANAAITAALHELELD